jgi:hypothetical protein
MKQRPRIYYTATQKDLMWERWKKEILSSRLPSYLIEIIRPYKASLCKLAALDRHPELDPN